ncbi:MAG: hypothetical protein U0M63_01005 [Alistipes onderdonkii]|jgi:hypothetical protein|nr:hypothetical protein [Alistipes onderdonkii]MEE0848231.1 hypothetical protein [Alistipes onderdonkii]
METVYLLLGIIMLVFGILQIILFFKLWGMTNDVVEIKKSVVKPKTNADAKWELRKCIIAGNKDQAEEIIIHMFVDSVKNIETTSGDSGYLGDLVKSTKSMYEKIGKEVPAIIAEAKSVKDISRLM